VILSHTPPCSCKSKEKEKEKKRNINNDLAILPSHDNRSASQSSPFHQLRQLESAKEGQGKLGPITC